jgi:hypothetical protein
MMVPRGGVPSASENNDLAGSGTATRFIVFYMVLRQVSHSSPPLAARPHWSATPPRGVVTLRAFRLAGRRHCS